MGARGAGDRRAAPRVPRARRGHPAGHVDQPRLRHRAAAGARRTSRENAVQRPRRLQLNDNWSSYVRVFHDQGTSDAARRRQRPRRPHRRRIRPTRCSTCRASCRIGTDQRVQVRLQRGADAHRSARRRRSTASTSAASHQPERLGRQHRHRRPGRQRRASRCPAAWFAPTARRTAAAQPYDPYSLTFADSLSSCRGNHFLKVGGECAHDPDGDRPARRHHLHVREPHRLPGQPRRRRFSTSAT